MVEQLTCISEEVVPDSAELSHLAEKQKEQLSFFRL
jgi:hypothetical protein